MGARILLAAFGSLGDLHPYLAVGLALRARGHEVAIASGDFYREKIVAAGFPFHSLRPRVSPTDRKLVEMVMDPRKGPEHVLRGLVLPAVRDTFDDLLAAATGADLLVGHPLMFGVPLVAEVLGLPWISTVLSPVSFFSAHDPSVLGPLGWMKLLRRLGPRANGWVIGRAKQLVLPWTEPVVRLRAELGLPPGGHPVFEGQHSPHLVLAMFSPVLARPQVDWPPRVTQTGFAFYDQDGIATGLPPELERFLAAGERAGAPPPIVFTLGSAAVRSPGRFFAASAAAALRLGRRAVLVGAAPETAMATGAAALPADLPDSILITPYVAYSRIFPHAAAIVHQGGIGTVSQALAAGKPTVVVPFSHDQPDNASRLERLGISRTIPRARYSARRAAKVLAALLADREAADRAEAIGARVRAEDGVEAACVAIESLLRSREASPSRPASAAC